MANWENVLAEIEAEQQQGHQQFLSAHSTVRVRYLKKLFEHTKRNTITYYSSWQQKPPSISGIEINDDDRNGFIRVIEQLDPTKGLDIIIHTPGGEIGATESIIRYLMKYFKGNARAIVPHTCMSGGTLMALSCEAIIMGKHSCIGPIDPQMYGGGVPATGIIEEFEKACRESEDDPVRRNFWEKIIGKYPPTMIGDCTRAIAWSKKLAHEILKTNMLKDKNPAYIKRVVGKLVDYDKVFSHGQPIDSEKAKKINLKILDLEEFSIFQELILTLHHCYVHTFRHTPALKIIENHNGAHYIKTPPETS